MIQIHTTKNKRIIRASLEESTQRALTVSQDVKIPDGPKLKSLTLTTHLDEKIEDWPALIDKDLLKEIRDLITLCTLIDKSGQCKAMSDKLDNLYPFLK